MSARTLLLTIVALLAFAANSVLCRFALDAGEVDAATFTAIRLISGAVVLWLVVAVARRPPSPVQGGGGSWAMAFFLFAYAVAFSFSYIELTAATGGLILFGCVQATMIVYGIVKGERPRAWEWVGLFVALCGLAYLFVPRLEAPSLVGGALMACAGIAWGFYSVLGRGVPDATQATAGNFVRAAPFALVVGVAGLGGAHLTAKGAVLAVVSGAITSGLGYVVWYHALRGLTATRAAVVQLAVPVIVALGGVAFIGEALTWPLVLSGLLILGGIGVSVFGRSHR